eukprot:tig00020685_g12964.t1
MSPDGNVERNVTVYDPINPDAVEQEVTRAFIDPRRCHSFGTHRFVLYVLNRFGWREARSNNVNITNPCPPHRGVIAIIAYENPKILDLALRPALPIDGSPSFDVEMPYDESKPVEENAVLEYTWRLVPLGDPYNSTRAIQQIGPSPQKLISFRAEDAQGLRALCPKP